LLVSSSGFARASCRWNGAPSVTAPTGFGETPATSEDRDTILVMQPERDTMKLDTTKFPVRRNIFPVRAKKFPVRCATGKVGATHWNYCTNWCWKSPKQPKNL